MLEEMNSNSHGVYSEILVEKDFLNTTTKTPFVVVHFYHKDFKRCAIIDKHLAVSPPSNYHKQQTEDCVCVG